MLKTESHFVIALNLTNFITIIINSVKLFNMAAISLKINGKVQQVEAEDDIPLLWLLRDHLDMVGTKYGCGIGMCGACTVLVNGTAMRSCSVKANTLQDAEIVTIEGLAENGGKVIQAAWIEEDVPQCGYCQAGQIMNAVGLLKSTPNPTDEQIDNAMEGNLCRCGSYIRIKAAIRTAASKGGIS